jgi:hypothetical protein
VLYNDIPFTQAAKNGSIYLTSVVAQRYCGAHLWLSRISVAAQRYCGAHLWQSRISVAAQRYCGAHLWL